MLTPNRSDVFLFPGDHFVGDARHRVRTLLGSCVAITLWHAQRRVGAMSHFLLSARHSRDTGSLDGRYGGESLLLMLHELSARGVPVHECQAKLFGGSDMFPNQGARDSAFHVGRRNGETARALLQSRGLRVVAESLFGVGHRQVVFDIGDGAVWSRQVDPDDVTSLPTQAAA